MFGDRGGYGRGGNAHSLLPTPARFFSLARGGLRDRGRGKDGRHVESTVETSSTDMGAMALDLQVVLPNFIPNLNVLVEGEEDDEWDEVVMNSVSGIDGNGVGGEHEGVSGGGDSLAQSYYDLVAAERVLDVGKRIGVTFRCDDVTMIERLVQLEERDRKEKETRGMGNSGVR